MVSRRTIAPSGPQGHQLRGGLRDMSLLHIFRDSAARRDGRDGSRRYVEGERDLTLVSQIRREVSAGRLFYAIPNTEEQK